MLSVLSVLSDLIVNVKVIVKVEVQVSRLPHALQTAPLCIQKQHSLTPTPPAYANNLEPLGPYFTSSRISFRREAISLIEAL